jgi:hypothetical protein
LRNLVGEGGFTDVSVRAVDAAAQFSDADAYFATAGCLAPPLAAALSAASDDAQAAVRATVADLVVQYRTDEGLRIPAQSLLCLARRSY